MRNITSTGSVGRSGFHVQISREPGLRIVGTTVSMLAWLKAWASSPQKVVTPSIDLRPLALPLTPENRNKLSLGPLISVSVLVNAARTPNRSISSSSTRFELSLMLRCVSRPHSTRSCRSMLWTIRPVATVRVFPGPRPPCHARWRKGCQRSAAYSGRSICACGTFHQIDVEARGQRIVGV